ncbi:MAG: electron transfer flavoprotein beta subunit/FixA family protein [Dethiobacter sp.]|jgi:electron transfer flavoprotein beta subunit|nr:MAG: electron transfer flavoprotein beta subunit/FixA family protein [Dethiobacter sp.]
MNIIVCVKQIIDPEIPAAIFKIDPNAKRAIPPDRRAFIISDYDEVAVEAAIRIKEAKGGKVTVLSLGSQSVIETIKHCLAMGADEGILLTDPLFEEEDRSLTAYALAMAIKKVGEFDLIFCGRQEGDWDAGQVSLGIAEILGIPSVNPVKKVEVKNGTILVKRIVDDGYEVIEIPCPALVTVSNELGKPRYPDMKGIMMAARKKISIWTSQDIDAEPSKLGPSAAKVKMLKLYIPVNEARCEFVEGETPEEAGANLALRLRKAKLI